MSSELLISCSHRFKLRIMCMNYRNEDMNGEYQVCIERIKI